MSININPVNLDGVKDGTKYRMIAFLIDRGDFLKDIEQGRKLLGLSELIPYQEVQGWKTANIKERVDIIKDQFENASEPLPLITGSYKSPHADIKSFSERVNGFIPSDNYQAGLRYFLIKYKRPAVYLPVIEYALLSGFVTDKDFRNVEIFIANQPDFFDYFFYPPSILIYVNPGTELQELKQVYREKFELISQEYIKMFNSQYKTSKIGNTKIVRKWYWQKEAKLSWKHIYQQAKKNKETATEWEGMRQAVIRYQKILTQKL